MQEKEIALLPNGMINSEGNSNAYLERFEAVPAEHVRTVHADDLGAAIHSFERKSTFRTLLDAGFTVSVTDYPETIDRRLSAGFTRMPLGEALQTERVLALDDISFPEIL